MRAILIVDDDPASLARTLRSLELSGRYTLQRAEQRNSSAPVTGELINYFRSAYSLTRRESELLLVMLQEPHLTYQQIADQEQTTRNTIKTYYKRIYTKLDIRSRTDLCQLVAVHTNGGGIEQVREVGSSSGT